MVDQLSSRGKSHWWLASVWCTYRGRHSSSSTSTPPSFSSLPSSIACRSSRSKKRQRRSLGLGHLRHYLYHSDLRCLVHGPSSTTSPLLLPRPRNQQNTHSGEVSRVARGPAVALLEKNWLLIANIFKKEMKGLKKLWFFFNNMFFCVSVFLKMI